MVTRRRKIENEQDKFGGFVDIVPADRSVFRSSEAMNMQEDNRMYSTSTTTMDPEITFSGREAVGSRRETLSPSRETVRTFPQIEHNKTRRSKALAEEDLMPSIKTMAYVDQKTKATPRESMESKTKVMLAVYMIVAILLAAIVIGTGIVINSLNANINQISSEIEASNNTIADQATRKAILNDPYYIMGVAQDQEGLNMVHIDPNSVTEIEVIPFIEEPVAADTNWFDKFCDWVQNLLGG